MKKNNTPYYSKFWMHDMQNIDFCHMNHRIAPFLIREGWAPPAHYRFGAHVALCFFHTRTHAPSHKHLSPVLYFPFFFSFLPIFTPSPLSIPAYSKMSFAPRIALRQLTRLAAPRSFSVLARQTTLAQVPRAAACKVNLPSWEPEKA